MPIELPLERMSVAGKPATMEAIWASLRCRPLRKQRVIDQRIGDFIRHRGRSYITVRIEAYREAWVDRENEDNPTMEGNTMCGS